MMRRRIKKALAILRKTRKPVADRSREIQAIAGRYAEWVDIGRRLERERLSRDMTDRLDAILDVYRREIHSQVRRALIDYLGTFEGYHGDHYAEAIMYKTAGDLRTKHFERQRKERTQ